MARLYARENKDGSIVWRVIFQRKGKKTICLTFGDKEEAQKFIDSNEADYLLKDMDFHIQIDTLRMRRERELKKRGLL